MCLTVSRQSRDHRPLSRDPSVSFHKKFPNCLKRPKTLFDSQPTVAWPQPLSRDRSATFFKILPNRLKRLKTLFDSRQTVAWPQPLSRDRSATFFKIFPNRLKRPENVVWQSADGRVTSDHRRVTVQRLFSKLFFIAWNVQKTLFDSRSTVAWPQPLSRDRSATFFKKLCKLLETSKKRCLTVGRRSRDLRPLLRDRSATFFKIVFYCLKRPKNVIWQSVDGRVTSTTVAWPFSDFFQNFANCLKRPKNVVWQSADGRVTSDQWMWIILYASPADGVRF